MSYTIKHSTTIYHGRVFDLRVDQVVLPSGHITNLDIVQHPGAVVILPVNAQKHILFVRQYRHAAGLELLELPAGMLEAGEDPVDCALREIREETGMSAGRLERLGDFYLAPGYSTEHLYIYLASELFESPLPGDEDEFISTQSLPVQDAYGMIERGQIKDAKTLATLCMARSRLL